MDDWLVRRISFLAIPFQNWMVVTFALMLIAAFVNIAESQQGSDRRSRDEKGGARPRR